MAPAPLFTSIPPSPSASVPTFFPISDKEFAGAIAVNVFAILSAFALLAIIFRVVWLAGLRLFGRDISQYRDYVFFNTQLGYYAACLLLANMVNSVAGLMGLPFLIHRGITENGLCTAQAVVMQFGNIATAYFTVAIGIHTFNSLVLRKRQSIFVLAPAIFLGWSLAVVLAILPVMIGMGNVYGVSGLSCGVKYTFPKALFFYHLLPIFIAAFISAILYSLIFLVLRGSLVIKGGLKFSMDNLNERGDRVQADYQRFVAGIASSMIWYPAAYIFFLVPYSVTRLLMLAGIDVPFQVVVLAFVFWFSLGVANVFLLYNTQRALNPAFDAKTLSRQSSKRETDMSFGTSGAFKGMSEEPIQYSLTEKMIQEYRVGNRTLSPTTDSSSERHLLHSGERGASIYSVQSEHPLTVRNISPVRELNEKLNSYSLETSGTALQIQPEHNRSASADTITSLPPPPRRIRSPPAALQPFRSSRSPPSPVGRPTSDTSSYSVPYSPMSASSTYDRPPLRMAGLDNHARSVSSMSTGTMELDVSGWLSRQNPDGSMPSGLRNQPLLSAVQTSFPSPISDPSASPSARLRPLLLASVERTGSPILAQHYNRMYSPLNSPRR